MHHVAVGDAAAAAGVVASHAAQRRLGAGRHIDRIPQAVRLEGGIEVVEHDARFDFDGALCHVHIQDVANVFGVIDDQARAHCLAALAGTAAARDDGHLQVAADIECGFHVLCGARHEHADRHDLVDGRIGRVAAPVSA